jgi:hypothetical protein
MRHGYVGTSALAGDGYGDPHDVVAQEANRRSMDLEAPQELVSFSVARQDRWSVVHMVFRWPLGEDTPNGCQAGEP